ncbi:LysR family transcriptional regulator [Methylotenera sp.]|uniref:LysR family transcriptional regulator n=1 Tax=Methylotenera sp. TaxID=2051956 RepID=UPI0027201BAA|nr:LysR family transcriptional regulator [Methylotenera sp.]MDO9394012.1 LysR family transcriptional regulator [Methylotenera sp.]MDP1523071.1 LysR family transcriptional regulator [Methylotenera sp.]MDP2070806.1 LysR family transcriptional regulator [Methylotenera sp.]MDP2230536.1 LysR family transcriptional regulator [Methylotenera sp.]MDP3006332.1 LysR family transcriptional regulator [Methylotenera sp.]
MTPNISLEQWRTLITIVDAGGYAQAAEIMYKSQSAVTYAIQKIESLLEVKVFEIQGRKAILTPTGQMLYRRALALVNEANELEHAAHALSAGWEAVINIAAEILFPSHLLLSCMAQFGSESPHTRIELVESVIGGTSEALLKGEADIAISPQLPPGFLGDLLMRVRLVAVAHAEHPLHHIGHMLTFTDLRAYRHLVVRDSSKKRDQRAAFVEVDQRWTVSQVATSIEAVAMGYGFAWLPEEHIKLELKSGLLRPLPLLEGGVREIPLYLVLANPDFAGPGIRRMTEIIKNSVE